MQSIAAIMLAMVLAGCNLAGAPETVPDTPGTPTETSALPQTFIELQLGFMFDYPAGWRIDSVPGSLVQLYSHPEQASQPGGGHGFPPDQTKIEFIPAHPGDGRQSIDEFLALEEMNSPGHGGTLSVLERLVLAGNIPAARIQYTGGQAGDVPVMLVEVNGQLIQIAGYGDTARFDEIVRTLRTTD
jgi:hypothetical protein